MSSSGVAYIVIAILMVFGVIAAVGFVLKVVLVAGVIGGPAWLGVLGYRAITRGSDDHQFR